MRLRFAATISKRPPPRRSATAGEGATQTENTRAQAAHYLPHRAAHTWKGLDLNSAPGPAHRPNILRNCTALLQRCLLAISRIVVARELRSSFINNVEPDRHDCLSDQADRRLMTTHLLIHSEASPRRRSISFSLASGILAFEVTRGRSRHQKLRCEEVYLRSLIKKSV